MAAGYVRRPKNVTRNFQASSPHLWERRLQNPWGFFLFQTPFLHHAVHLHPWHWPISDGELQNSLPGVLAVHSNRWVLTPQPLDTWVTGWARSQRDPFGLISLGWFRNIGAVTFPDSMSGTSAVYLREPACVLGLKKQSLVCTTGKQPHVLLNCLYIFKLKKPIHN